MSQVGLVVVFVAVIMDMARLIQGIGRAVKPYGGGPWVLAQYCSLGQE